MRTASSVAAAGVMTAALGLAAAPAAHADTITEMVKNTGALESPFWAYMYENGFGYLDAARVSNDGKIACVNRKAGVPGDQIAALLQIRDYTAKEATAIVAADRSGSTSVHSFC